MPWIALTLLWIWPLLVGLGMAIAAQRRDAKEFLALIAILIHGVLLVLVAGPAVLDRLLNL
ncbi:hypothetical protein [Janibacter sp. G1551]|uniref:hypothetical protein n=1 Tax=Janibacter sp. G1551 TaxID=3420440 RepID=UPI003CFEC79B